jgi:hypothetical protein
MFIRHADATDRDSYSGAERQLLVIVGDKDLIYAVFSDTGLDVFLDGMKRNQGESVSSARSRWPI